MPSRRVRGPVPDDPTELITQRRFKMVDKQPSWFRILAALGIVIGGMAVGLYAQGTARQPASQPKPGSDERATDRAAIREALKDFVAAFEKGDAAAAAAHMTAGAE